MATNYTNVGLTSFPQSIVRYSNNNTVTAHSGGGQTNATQLWASYNFITTVAAIGDSVVLYPTTGGFTKTSRPLDVIEMTVVNQGANACQVYGSGTDTINGVAAATGVQLAAGATATFFLQAPGLWIVAPSQLTGAGGGGVTLLTTNGAIPPHVGGTYVITKAGVLSDTLAAPTAGTDDGKTIVITSATANSHVLTATGLLKTGTASVNVATFAAFAGASLTLMAYNGLWNVISSNAITFS